MKRAIIVGGALSVAKASATKTTVTPARRRSRRTSADAGGDIFDRLISEAIDADGNIVSRINKSDAFRPSKPITIPFNLSSKPYVPPEPIGVTCPSCGVDWIDATGKPVLIKSCHDCRLNAKRHGTTTCNKCRKRFRQQEELQTICPGCAYTLWLATAVRAPGADRPFHTWKIRSPNDSEIFVCEFCGRLSDQPNLSRYCTGPVPETPTP